MRAKTLPKLLLCLAATLIIPCGWLQLARLSLTPGEQALAPAVLPADLFPPLRQPLLLVFVHPRCSCTPATYRQLDRLLDQVQTPVDLVLASYQSAAISPQLRPDPATLLHHPFRQWSDVNGRLARRFHAATSGEVLLYSASGQLLFQGGITAGQGHAGDSPGAAALQAALRSARPAAAKVFSVFGCPIFRLGDHG